MKRMMNLILHASLCIAVGTVLVGCNNRSTNSPDKPRTSRDTTENDINYPDTTGEGSRMSRDTVQQDSVGQGTPGRKL